MTALARSSSLARGDQVPNAFDCGNLCFQQLRGSYEPKFGGFSQAPKFPQPVNMNLLLRWHVLNQGKDSDLALDMCVHTLRMMAKGGIFDHVCLVIRSIFLLFFFPLSVLFRYIGWHKHVYFCITSWPGFRSLLHRREMACAPF